MNDEEIKRIMSILKSSFHFQEDVEITFEANPSTLNDKKIETLKECGFNRVSLGMQSFRNEILKQNNCNHTVERALEIINKLLDNDFVINIDMLFGLDDQSEEDLLFELAELCKIDKPVQLSLFPIRVLPETPLHGKIQTREELKALYEKLLRLDKAAEDFLKANSFIREEIPIFYYKEGSYEHIYNSAEARIIGLGVSAGTVLDNGIGVNFSDVEKYCDLLLDQNKSPNNSKTFLTPQQNEEKFIFNRILFMNRSIPNFEDLIGERFEEYFNKDMGDLFNKVVNDMVTKKFIKFDDKGKIHFTTRFNSILDRFRLGVPSII